MNWRSCTILPPLLVCAGCLPSLSPDRAVAEAEGIRAAGQPGEALQTLLEARVDHPRSEALLFAIAYGEYAAATWLDAPGTAGEREELLRDALETFLRVSERAAGNLDRAAAFNAATVRLHLDGALERTDRYGERVENLRRAIADLEAIPEGDPHFSAAGQNLSHARYRLGLLLQNPPREAENGEDGDEEGQDPPPVSSVDAVTTQIPDAIAEVVDGSTIVLRLPPREDRP